MVKIAAIDLETRTIDDPCPSAILSLGVVYLPDMWKWYSLIHPGKKDIHPVTSACHHITKETFKTEPSIKIKKSFWRAMFGKQDYLVAHNAAFDSQYIPVKKPWICTYRCALQLYPDAPKHSLQALRYWLGLTPHLPPSLHPHNALYDAICLTALLQEMLRDRTADELYEISSKPLLLQKVRFGKHRDTLFKDVPNDYLRWILSKDFDEDVKYTATHYLERNDNGQRTDDQSQAAVAADQDYEGACSQQSDGR